MALDNYENIVNNFSTTILILAGPGSGKTYLLADRTKRLLKKGIVKNNITILTFGKDANLHMRYKLTESTGFNIPFKELPYISTMHSLGFEILNMKPHDVNLLKVNLIVQEDEKVKRLMYRDAAFTLDYTEEDSKDSLKCKQNGDCKEDLKEKKCKICKKYREIMSKCNYVDFDDQIIFACRILKKNLPILKKYQSQAKYLLIDEYQDINAAQFRLIELLSRESRNNLFVVGDDAQSIYGFRGGDPKFILHFKKYFPDSKTLPLPFSKRCHDKIMEDAIKVLKKYYVNWSGECELEFTSVSGEKPHIWQLSSEKTEAEMVAKIAQQYIQEKKSILVLVPKKDFFPLIMQELSKRSIAYSCPISFLPKRIERVKLFMDWVTNPNNSFKTRLILEDLINNNGIAKVPGAGKSKRLNPETIKNRIKVEIEIAKLWEQVDKKHDLFSIIKNIEKPNRTIIIIRDALLKLCDLYTDFKKDIAGEFLKHLSILTGIWLDPVEFLKDLTKIIEITSYQCTTGVGWVRLNTMKKAKGLEADVVVIVGLEDDIIPSHRNNIAEESRLFYVSMTRAKEKLYLLHSFKRRRDISYGEELRNKKRSRFLDAIGRESEWKRFKTKNR
jgi:DNA helicase II / ATP-dependent DNA helicase PcrA